MSLPSTHRPTLYDWPSWPLEQLLDELQDAGADARDDLRATEYMDVAGWEGDFVSSDGLAVFVAGPSTRETVVEALAQLGFTDEGNDPGVCIDVGETVLVDVGHPHPPLGSLVKVLDISVDIDDPARDDESARARIIDQLRQLHPDWQFIIDD